MDAKDKLREILKRIHNQNRDNRTDDNVAQSLKYDVLHRLFIRKSRKQSAKTVSDSDPIPSPGNLPESPKMILFMRSDMALVAHDYSHKAEGVLDSGATKTVIGSQLVGSLLKALDPSVRSQVSRSTCQVTFRFGNINTLDAHQALVVPVGPLNLHIAIVPGNTPFLISNTLMRTLKAIVDTEHHLLHSPLFHKPVKLKLSPRGLFLLDINDLVHSSAKSSQTDRQDTFTVDAEKKLCEPTEPVLKTTIESLGSEKIHQEQENNTSQRRIILIDQTNDDKTSSVVSSVVSASRDNLIASPTVVDPNLAADHDRQPAPAFAAPTCSSGGTCAGRSQQIQPAPIAEHDRGYFGQTHKGKSYLTMWQQHQKWVQWLLQHYGDSKKASHRRIVHYFHMEIERCELEGRSIPLTDAQPSTKNQMPVQPQNKSKAKAKMMPRVVEPRADSPDQQLVLDPETEEFSWEPVHHLMEEEETYLGNLGAEVGTLQSRME